MEPKPPEFDCNQNMNIAKLPEMWQADLLQAYLSASHRTLLFDYDGTLAPFVNDPNMAIPTLELKTLLMQLVDDNKNQVVIISGRGKDSIGEWFKDIPITLVVEHGGFIRLAGQDNWEATKNSDNSWKPQILNIFEQATSDITGSSVEHKTNSLVWHYRAADNLVLAQSYKANLITLLQPTAQVSNLKIEQGSMIIEVRPSGIDKGQTAIEYSKGSDFIFAIGDDMTDEAMFKALPDDAWTIKVRPGETAANYYIQDIPDVYKLLQKLVDQA